ncbi:MAG TPA: hypothetical protein VNO35_17610 [Steroidobacteraceae bacterium]|nr:hypothetical protein [Steroidobacteraceae bacterium]
MRLSPEQLQQIERTVRRAPEVIVRISAPQSNDFDAVQKYLDLIARQGELRLETDSAELMGGPRLGRRLMEEMDLDLEEYRRRPELTVPRGHRLPKLVHKIVLSMPQGTSCPRLLSAARNFLREQFGNRHRYAFVLHAHKAHPYVHVVVKAVSEHGVRLHIKKPTLRKWRLEFARHLREQNIAANATERALRGQIRESKPNTLYHTELRGESIWLQLRTDAVTSELMRRGLQVEPGKVKLVQTRKEVQRRWRVIRQLLMTQGARGLAEEVGRFVDAMQPPMTAKEQLARQLSEQVRHRRAGTLPLVGR